MSAEWKYSPHERGQVAAPPEPPRLTSVEQDAGEGDGRVHNIVHLAVIIAAQSAWLLTLGYLGFRFLV